MAKPIKVERNKLVVKLRTKYLKGDRQWTWQAIANEVGLKARSTVHEIYDNEKRRSAMKN